MRVVIAHPVRAPPQLPLRVLCSIDDKVIAAGSSPSTIALHDLDEIKTTKMVTLTLDVRNAIHSLACILHE